MRDRIVLHTLWMATAVAILVPSFADPDLWGHLLFGSALLRGDLHLENTFAYTTPSQPWLNHELLAELIMAGAWKIGGAPGLVALKLLLGLGTAAVLWRTASRRSADPTAATLAVVLGLLVMQPGFMIRPQLFTMLLLAVMLDVAARAEHRARGTARFLPLIAVVWVNVHGGVLAGIGLVAIGVIASAVLLLRDGRLERREALSTVTLLVALAAALLVNPYGHRLVRFLLFEVTPAVPITEWAPVNVLDASFPAFKLMLLVVAAGLVVVRPNLAEALIMVVAAAVALRHQRHIPLFAIATAPFVATTLATVGRRLAARVDGTLAGLWRLGLRGAAVIQLAVAVAAAITWRGTIHVSAHHYPVQAVRFLAQNDIVGNVALPFSWGEYALWALPAGSRIAIDGRFTTAYPGPLLFEAWRFMEGGPGWDDLLSKYPTDVVIADRSHATARLLKNDPKWQYVYSDPVSIVFLRQSERHADVLTRFREGALVYDRSPVPTSFPAG